MLFGDGGCGGMSVSPSEYGRAWCDYAEGSLTVVTTWDNVLPAIVYVPPSPVQSDDEEEEHQ